MPYSLDCVDTGIIRILQRDGRTPNVEIARRVGISEATVRKRLDRLISDGTVQITAIPDPVKIGLPTITFFTLEVDLSQLDRIANELVRLPEVRAVHYTSGESDLILEAWFPSADELLRFLTRHIAAIPGINHAATFHVLRTIKSSSDWVLPPPVPPHILIVDDDPDFVEISRLTLTRGGYHVSSATSGEEGMALMRVVKPDLVILDVMMRGLLDGLITCQEMRTDGDLRAVPVLMVSSITDTNFARLLPEQGNLPADSFLVKPIEPGQFLAEVERLLRSR